MRCPSCSEENPNKNRFCGNCGTALITAAPHPRSHTPPPLAERILAEQAALKARAIPEGERKAITALFADIKGSVELMEDLAPEEAGRIVDPAIGIMIEAVHHYEGFVTRSTGDGIFALFGAPIAHEDHPRRAIRAALRMQEEIGRYSASLKLEKGVPLEIRVRLNTGEVVVRSIRKDDLHTDYTPIGHSTNLAARMESLARHRDPGVPRSARGEHPRSADPSPPQLPPRVSARLGKEGLFRGAASRSPRECGGRAASRRAPRR